MDLDEAYDEVEQLQFSLKGAELHDALERRVAELGPGEPGRAVFLPVGRGA